MAADDDRSVVGHERLTALASATLLGLILIELATMPNLSAAVPLHVFIGVAFIGPLTVKLRAPATDSCATTAARTRTCARDRRVLHCD